MMNDLKQKGLDLFNNIKQQAVNGINSARPPQAAGFMDGLVTRAKTLYSHATSAVADAVTKRAGAKIYLECDTKGNYKITVEGKRAAVKDALEKLLKEQWLCNSK